LSFEIAFKKSVSRDLKRIDKNQAERILRRIEEDLPEKADSFPSLTGKFAGLRKFRVGDYRVIYTIVEDRALVLRISHRRESYRYDVGRA
jgi:mRNA interferase RelE/StbE